MTGRHQYTSAGRPRLRWLAAGALSLLIAAATVVGFSLTPAGAATTVNAQLSLSGVATKDTVLGGSQIGVHPGDTVDFHASAAPTAGLENVPVVGDILGNVLSLLTNPLFQVKVTFGSNFPGGARSFTLGGPSSGPCKGDHQQLPVTFPTAGTYAFNWTVQYVAPGLLGGCSSSSLNKTDLDQLAALGIKVNATNGWAGKIVVADNPPANNIGIQLPSLGATPNILGVQLPSVSLPGLSATVPVTVPNLGGLTGGSGKSSSSGTKTQPDSGGSGGGLPVPALVVPGGGNLGVAGGGGGGIFNSLPLPGLTNPGTTNGLLPVSSSSGAAASAPAASHPSAVAEKSVGLANPKPATSQLSVILALIAIIALALVAGVYAKLYVLRRD